jgi:putative membrane protein
MDMMMQGGMPLMMFVMWAFWLLVLVAIGAGIWWLARRRHAASRDPALDALRERYARGEITRDEFEARRRDLAA